MERAQPARYKEPFFLRTSTGDEFEEALRFAARANSKSMEQLRLTVSRCVESLRADGMQCEAALLTMKAFVKEIGLKHKRQGSPDVLHSEKMLEQIVRWCITEYYAEPKPRS